MDPQTLLDSTFFLIPSFVPKKGLDPQTLLDPIYLPIPSFMAKKTWIHYYPQW